MYSYTSVALGGGAPLLGGGAPLLGGGGFGYQPTINLIVPWPQSFGLAYQQFVNGGYGSYGGGFPMGGGLPLGGYGASPLGLGGYGGLQGVPIGFGVTTN